MVGSSPHTRGTRGRRDHHLALSRLIPAHAGNTRTEKSPEEGPAAHPRTRGEHPQPRSPHDPPFGSSPHTRGTQGPPPRPPSRPRLIPAHAGNTGGTGDCSAARAAHPRTRGEHSPTPTSRPVIGGSSPHTRGTRTGTRWCSPRRRLIPAHAGNTPRNPGASCAHPAHPRTRGEHLARFGARPPTTGSSPHTRGTRHPHGQDRGLPRLIPAHAGNTAAPGRR